MSISCNLCVTHPFFSSLSGLKRHQNRNLCEGNPKSKNFRLSSSSSIILPSYGIQLSSTTTKRIEEQSYLKPSRYSFHDSVFNLCCDSGNKISNSDVGDASDDNSDSENISNGFGPDWTIQREVDYSANREGISVLPVNHPDFMEPFLNLFQKKQLSMYQFTYGLAAIESTSFDEMVRCVQFENEKKRSYEQLQQLKLLNIFTEHNISRQAANELLTYMNEMNPEKNLNSDIRSLERDAYKGINEYCYGELTLPWPDYWNMQPIIETFPEVKLYIMNPIEAISYLFIDPEIMFLHKEQVHFECYSISQQDSRGREILATGDLMTSKWCHDTQKLIRDKDPNGHILPLIFYSDGVQVSANVNNKVTTAICTTGNFSDDLLNKNISKRVISYIPNFNIYSKQVLVEHLMSTLRIGESKVCYHNYYTYHMFP